MTQPITTQILAALRVFAAEVSALPSDYELALYLEAPRYTVGQERQRLRDEGLVV